MASPLLRRRRNPALTATIAALTVIAVVVMTIMLTATTAPRARDTLRAADLGIISHRGAASVAPENTLSAVQAGIAQGVEFVEIDLRLTRDRVPILMHDADVDRTTNGVGNVTTLRYSDIESLDAGSWFADEFRGERIPTFNDFLDVFTPARSLAFIELKGLWREDDVANLVTHIHDARITERVVLQSFNVDTMLNVASVAPETVTVLLTRDLSPETVTLIETLGVDGIGARLRIIESEIETVRRLQEQGIGSFAYTLNDEVAWEAAASVGVDLIVTDNAAQLQEWLTR